MGVKTAAGTARLLFEVVRGQESGNILHKLFGILCIDCAVMGDVCLLFAQIGNLCLGICNGKPADQHCVCNINGFVTVDVAPERFGIQCFKYEIVCFGIFFRIGA